jgi:hypothetical protein
MHSRKSDLLILLSVLFLFLFFFSDSSADVVYKQKGSTSGFMGMGNMEIETTIMLKGDKQNQKSSTKFVGAMAQYMPGVGEQSQMTITRLDKEMIWNIDMLKKTYTEMTFDDMKKMMGKAMAESEKAAEEDVETKVKVDVKKTGQKKKIAGYECEEFIIKVVAEGKDVMSGETQEFEVNTHLWVSPKVKGYDQIESFQKKMAEKMGFEGKYEPGLAQVLTRYSIEAEELTKKMKEIKGLPMLTVVKMKATGETAELDEEEKAEQKEAMEMAMKMMGKKMEKAEEPEEEGVLMTMTTEITEIEVKDVTDSEFELPEGLKKQDVPMQMK